MALRRPDGVTVQQVKPAQRKPRYPQHRFQIRQRPFQIQPFMLAPVLPGETLKNLTMQARIVTDPIRNPLIGWWAEHYFFYVKHRDLDERDTLTNMMLDQSTDVSALKQTVSADAKMYTFVGGMKWASMCLKRIVEEYFRDEGEAWNTWLIDSVPAAQINQTDWLQSANLDSAMPDIADDDDMPLQELDVKYQQWQYMQQMQMTNMSYEDWLATHGVRPTTVELHKPELLRYTRNWSYPSNTIDPTTGAPTSAVSWTVSERADKDRFFTEPGFIFGVSVMRPKVYLSSQTGAAAGLLDNAFGWLPAIMADAVWTSLREIAASAGPVPNQAAGYWVDLRDLFLYGDQYINFALSETDAGLVALPSTALQYKYPTKTIVDLLFVDAAADTKRFIRQDGVVSNTILGHQVDHT